MKKGFTLIELLGVIIIIAALMILTLPSIINFIKKGSESVDNATLKLIYNAADMYIKDNQTNFPRIENGKYCISLRELVDSGKIKGPIKLYSNDKDLTDLKTVQVTYNNKFSYSIVDNDECKEGTDIYLAKRGYQILDYIESTGTQYIDTEYVLSSNCDVEIKWKCNTSTNDKALFGANKYWLNIYATSFYVRYGDEESGNLGSWNLNQEYVTKINGGVWSLNNDIIKDYSNQNFETSNTAYLFALNNSTTVSYNYGQKSIYYFKVWNNGKLERDMVPCYRKSDDEIGMYDLVENKFYSKQGTGEFIKSEKIEGLPKQYQQVQYIEGTGTQYINTGIYLTNDDEIVASILFQDTNSHQGIFGARSGANSKNYTATYQSPKVTSGASGLTLDFNNSSNAPYRLGLTSIPLNTKFTIIMNKNTRKFSDLGSNTTTCNDTFTTETPCYIFYSSGNLFATNVSKFIGRLYSFKIKGKFNGIPCYEKSNPDNVGLYDLETDTFFENQGTGTFIAGPEVN